jgi:signal peptidase I
MAFVVRLMLVIFSAQLIACGALHAESVEGATGRLRMESVSMVPTIAKNDIVSFVPYPNISNARRGDVVIFRHPVDNRVWVKRLIGMPGDKIQMKEGRLYINGELVQRELTAKIHTEDFYGRETDGPTYKETLPGGVSYTIIEIQGDTGFNDNTQVFAVAQNSYFMMGDNRDNSTDSRVPPDQGGVGYVPGRNIPGYVATHAGEWEKRWSSVKGEAAKQCAKIFDSFQLQAVCMDNEKNGYDTMQGNFGMPGDVASKAKERCAKIFDTFQLQAVCMESEHKGYDEMKKY